MTPQLCLTMLNICLNILPIYLIYIKNIYFVIFGAGTPLSPIKGIDLSRKKDIFFTNFFFSIIIYIWFLWIRHLWYICSKKQKKVKRFIGSLLRKLILKKKYFFCLENFFFSILINYTTGFFILYSDLYWMAF